MYDKFDKYLAGIGKGQIVETGFTGDVFHLADYAERSGSELHSVDLDAKALQALHLSLVQVDLAPFVALHLQDPGRFLFSRNWIDAAFLFSPVGLNLGLEHFKLCVSSGASLVVMKDYQTTAAWAVQFAKQQLWTVTHDDYGYSYLVRE